VVLAILASRVLLSSTTAQLSKLGGKQNTITSHCSINCQIKTKVDILYFFLATSQILTFSLSKYILNPMSSYFARFSGLLVDTCMLLASTQPKRNTNAFKIDFPMIPHPIRPIFRSPKAFSEAAEDCLNW